ncbi:MAG: methyltransferase domain-containing protein [Nitrospira sp.]|nr:methyltransferase domain-containing protein [Nitrospira sp.]
MKTIVLLAVLCATLAGSALAEDQHQHRRPDDIKQYLEHLNSTERDRYQKPAEVIDALKLKPGMAIADLGSGSGYFTRRFIEAVTETGMVYAVDVEPEMLAYAKESVIHMHTAYTAEFILAQPDNPKLPFASVDLLFVCNTIHHLEDRPKYFSDLKSSLKPGARIAIVDFYPDERSGDLGFPKHHLVARDTIVQEMTAAGYQLAREHSFLPKQYFLEFVAQ